MSIDTIAPPRPHYDRDTAREDDPTAIALGRYIDSHDSPNTDEFALHTLVGLASVDRDLLRSSAGIGTATLTAKREALYALTCQRLATSPSRAVSRAIDQIASAIAQDNDPASMQVAATLRAIQPEVAQVTTPHTAEKSDSIVVELSTFVPSKRLVRGLVVTAMTAGIVMGAAAPHAAAEGLPPADDTRAVDTETTTSSEVTDQSDIAGFLNATFGDAESTTGTTEPNSGDTQTVAPTPPETNAAPADTTNETVAPSPQESTPSDPSTPPDAASTAPGQQGQTAETPVTQPEEVSSPIEEGLSDIFGGDTSSSQETGDSVVEADPNAIPSDADREQAAADLTHAINVGDEKKLDKTVKSIEGDLGTIGLVFTILDVSENPRADNQQEEPTDPEQPGDKGDDKGDKSDPGKKDENKDKGSSKEQGSSKYDKLLNVIASWESGGNYNAYFGHGSNHEIKFTSMTVGEVLKWQRNYLDSGSPSSAMGKYQVLFRTLSSLVENYDSISKDDTFDKNLQDEIAIILLKQRGLNDYMNGKISDKEFAHNLSKEWASLPSVTGKHPNASYYDGDGLNKAHVKVATLLKAVRSIRGSTAHSNNGGCPSGTKLVKGITEGWTRDGEKKDIELCAIPGTKVVPSTATEHWKKKGYNGTTAHGVSQIAVNKKIAKDTLEMARAARKAGITLTATVGYRSIEEQCSILAKNGSMPAKCDNWIDAVPGNWKSGILYSNHMMGYSFDAWGAAVARWMEKHGSKYGFINDVYISEGWDRLHFTNKG